MRLTRKAALLGAAFALTSVFTLAACSNDSSGGAQNVDLSGNYEVVAIAFPATATEAPVFVPATGTAVLTSTDYTVDIPGIGLSEGTYVAKDDGTFQQSGTVTPAGQVDPIPTQCTGTWNLDVGATTTFTIDTTCLGSRTVTKLELVP